MDQGDKVMFAQVAAGAVASILVWWFIIGRRKYGTKGMRP